MRWWLLVPSVALVLTAAWVLGTAWGPVVAGHPAYLVTVVATGALGAAGVPVSVGRGGRRSSGPRPGR